MSVRGNPEIMVENIIEELESDNIFINLDKINKYKKDIEEVYLKRMDFKPNNYHKLSSKSKYKERYRQALLELLDMRGLIGVNKPFHKSLRSSSGSSSSSSSSSKTRKTKIVKHKGGALHHITDTIASVGAQTALGGSQ